MADDFIEDVSFSTPADKKTRLARIRAHTIFDAIWKTGIMKRHEAYGWMRQAMSLSRTKGHITLFDEAQCEQLIQLVYRDYPQFQTRYSRLAYGDDEL